MQNILCARGAPAGAQENCALIIERNSDPQTPTVITVRFLLVRESRILSIFDPYVIELRGGGAPFMINL